MGVRSRYWDLGPSCVAIARTMSLRIIDPVLYPPTIDGHEPESITSSARSLPKFARNRPRLKEGNSI